MNALEGTPSPTNNVNFSNKYIVDFQAVWGCRTTQETATLQRSIAEAVLTLNTSGRSIYEGPNQGGDLGVTLREDDVREAGDCRVKQHQGENTEISWKRRIAINPGTKLAERGLRTF